MSPEEVMGKPGYAEVHSNILKFMDTADLPDNMKAIWGMMKEPGASLKLIEKAIKKEKWQAQYYHLGNELTDSELFRLHKSQADKVYRERKRKIEAGEAQRWPDTMDWIDHMHEKYGRFSE